MHILIQMIRLNNMEPECDRNQFIRDLITYNQRAKLIGLMYGLRMLAVFLLGSIVTLLLVTSQDGDITIFWKKTFVITSFAVTFSFFFLFYFQFSRKMKTISLHCPVCSELLSWKQTLNRKIVCAKCRSVLKD